MDEKVKRNLKTLAELQFTDTQREAIEKQLAGVQQRIAALDEQLSAFQRQVAQEISQLDSARKQYRADESEVKSIEAHIVRSDDKLRSVKTNKEYQSVLKEIEDLNAKKAAVEDRMIETLEQIETADRQAAVLKADLDDLKEQVESQQAEIRTMAEEQRLELEGLDEERESIWSQLEPKLQKMYSRAKHQGGGIAVAAVVDAVCQVCRVNIPPQAFIELLRLNTMSMCPNCQRIIYPKVIMEPE